MAKRAKIKELLHVVIKPVKLDPELHPPQIRLIQNIKLQKHLLTRVPIQTALDHLRQR